LNCKLNLISRAPLTFSPPGTCPYLSRFFFFFLPFFASLFRNAVFYCESISDFLFSSCRECRTCTLFPPLPPLAFLLKFRLERLSPAHSVAITYFPFVFPSPWPPRRPISLAIFFRNEPLTSVLPFFQTPTPSTCVLTRFLLWSLVLFGLPLFHV